jgi:hypothetical protein
MALADAAPFAVAAWTLDEASGTRADSVGSNDLADTNTVGSAAGLFGNAADFELSSAQYLSIADNTALSMGNVKMTLTAWLKFESVAATQRIIGKLGSSHGEYSLWYSVGSGKLVWEVYGAASFGTQAVQTSDTFGTVSSGVWLLVVVTHDPDADQIGISVNGGAFDTEAHSAGIYDGNTPFELGAYSNGPTYYDGLMDDVVVLKGYCLNATEAAELYNSGAGVAFADWAGGATANRRRRLLMGTQ